MTRNPDSPLPPPRSTYRHGDLRRALLDAGIDLARAGGPEAVVLRVGEAGGSGFFSMRCGRRP